MVITIYTTILGLITGLVYAFALGFAYEDGLVYGFGVGLIMGLFLVLIKRSITSRNVVNQSNTIFLSNYLMALLLLVSIGSGLMVWIFRVAIF